MSPFSRARYGSLLLLVLTVASLTKVSGEGQSLLSWLAGALGAENHDGSNNQAVPESYVLQEWDVNDEEEDNMVVSEQPEADFQPVEEKPRHRRAQAPSPAAFLKKGKGKSPVAPGGKGAKAPGGKPKAPGQKRPKAPSTRRRH